MSSLADFSAKPRICDRGPTSDMTDAISGMRDVFGGNACTLFVEAEALR